METKHSLKKRLVAATCGATVIALAAGGVAMATTPSSSSSPKGTSKSGVAASSQGRRHDLRHELRWLARHTVHANLIVSTSHGYKTITIDRGVVAKDSSSSISITRPDGVTVTDSISSSTRFPGLPESKITKGDQVALVSGTASNALVVWAPRAGWSATG